MLYNDLRSQEMKPQFGRGSFACVWHPCRISYIKALGRSPQMELRASHIESIDNNDTLVACRRSLSWQSKQPALPMAFLLQNSVVESQSSGENPNYTNHYRFTNTNCPNVRAKVQCTKETVTVAYVERTTIDEPDRPQVRRDTSPQHAFYIYIYNPI